MSSPIVRRQVLRGAAIGTLGIFAQACARVLTPVAPVPEEATGAPTQSAPAATLTPFPVPEEVLVTSNKDFYTVAYREEKPELPTDWMLQIEGNVQNPRTWLLDEIKQLPAVVEMRTLECISNPAGGPLIGNAIWRGVRLRDLLEQANVKSNTTELYLQAYDGYDTSIPVALAENPDSLLVYEMNGEALPLEHGAPLRCLFPGRYGMKQPKWIKKITATVEPHRGYWDVQGWSKEASILVNSRIDEPEELDTIVTPTFTMRGVGFSNEIGIKTIEVSTDDGKTWHEAELTRGPSPYVWTRYEWTGPTPPEGDHILLARVTDNNGKYQVLEDSPILGGTFPNGTLAMHQVPVRIKPG